jgi:endonuclease-3
MRGLVSRVARHLRTEKTVHWHIDSLLAQALVQDVQLFVTDDPTAECRSADAVAAWPGVEPVPGFGASDCDCPTHLHWFRRRPGGSLIQALAPRDSERVMAVLHAHYEDITTRDLDPFETLTACILSLRTQDPVTHAASARLHARYPGPQALAGADQAELAACIYPVGMYRQKAGTLIRIARLILDRHHGQVPADLDALLALPGVGRKTANLVLSFAHHLPAICVDTHVHRISNRLGWARTRTPDETEVELARILPQAHWKALNPLLVQHGQQCCRPLRPACERCPLQDLCAFDRLQAESQALDGVPGAPGHPSLGK